MSYIKEQFKQAVHDADQGDELKTFEAGMIAGFKIALCSYGIWKDGRQVIGCQETPVREIIAREFGDQKS